jgi:hypothetical protein
MQNNKELPETKNAGKIVNLIQSVLIAHFVCLYSLGLLCPQLLKVRSRFGNQTLHSVSKLT